MMLRCSGRWRRHHTPYQEISDEIRFDHAELGCSRLDRSVMADAAELHHKINARAGIQPKEA
jgi:hypothetical protein